jgi:Fe2+ transport system protein B
MDIKINEDQLNELIGAALLQVFTPEKRDELIKEAVKSLLSPENDKYAYGGKKISPLQRIFADASETIAKKIFIEELQNNEAFINEIRELLTLAMSKVFADKENMAEAMGHEIRSAMLKVKDY